MEAADLQLATIILARGKATGMGGAMVDATRQCWTLFHGRLLRTGMSARLRGSRATAVTIRHDPYNARPIRSDSSRGKQPPGMAAQSRPEILWYCTGRDTRTVSPARGKRAPQFRRQWSTRT